MNYINIIILIIFLIYLYRGYVDGGLRIITGFLGIIIAYAFSVHYYILGSYILNKLFHIPMNFNRLISIIITFIIIALAFELLSSFLYKKIPKEFRRSTINKYIGAILSFVEGLILISFIIFIITTINFIPGQINIKNSIKQSSIGAYIIKENNKILKPIVGKELSTIKLNKNLINPSK